MKTLNRRAFLQGAAALATSRLPIPQLALGDDREPKPIFVQIQIEGGADVLQSLDPMIKPEGVTDDQLWRSYNDQDIIDAKGFLLGPTAKALAPHANDIALIRGIWMHPQTNSHESCRTYMASGVDKGPQRSRILCAEVGRQQSDSVCGVLVNTLREFSTEGANVRTTVLGDLVKQTVPEWDVRTWLAGLNSVKAAAGLFGGRDAFSTSSAQVAAVAAKIKAAQQSGLELTDELVLSIALRENVSSTVFWNLGGDYTGPGPGLDSHSGHADHINRQKYFWDRIGNLFTEFKKTPYGNGGASLFDYTTFYVTNEFTRTPHKVNDGTDHLTSANAAMLAGRGVRGGTFVGKSLYRLKDDVSGAPTLVGHPYDFATQRTLTVEDMKQLDPKNPGPARFIRPEDVIITLVDILGMDRAKYLPLKGVPARSIDALKK